MGKSIWLIAIMGLLTMLLLAVGMAMTLGQFQEVPAAEWVRLSESIGREYKAENVSVRVVLQKNPSAMVITYSSLVDSKFNLSMQNTEMESVANYAIKTYKGREQAILDEIQITRSETHGRGCFQQTYVAHFTLPNPLRRMNRLPIPGSSVNSQNQ